MGRIDMNLIMFKAATARMKLGLDESSPVDIEYAILNNKEFTIIYHPMGENISGLCIKEDNIKIIAINSQMSKGRQRYTMAHELCHLFFHVNDCYVCSANLEENKNNDLELEADIFASYFLAPIIPFYSDFMSFYNDKQKLEVACIKLEQKYGLSHLATLRRLRNDKLISEKEYNQLKVSPIALSNDLGYSKDLYLPTNTNTVIGKYISLAKELLERKKISKSKYDNMLLEANREDLVYEDSIYDRFD